MKFKILKKSKRSAARIGEMETVHGKITTPVFMPVGTVGAVKTLSPDELEDLGVEIILGNTYHLYLRPGDRFIKKTGGLHKFMGWDKPILTDSGGYQIFSLGKKFTNSKFQTLNSKQASKPKTQNSSLVKITSNGVYFRSHIDGSKHYFTPEKVIDIQRNLGSDIMMVLDVCTEYPASHKRAKETMEITHRWAKKSVEYYQKLKIKDHPSTTLGARKPKTGPLFGIIQGSVYRDLREESLRYLSSLPFDGIAIGGVSVGEGKRHMYQVMRWTGPKLPADKPHYIMGIGEPEDIIEAVRNGFDLFDCVLPTRLARHGVVWIRSSKCEAGSALRDMRYVKRRTIRTTHFDKRFYETLDLRKSVVRNDLRPLDPNCLCYSCRKGFSRAYLALLIKEKEVLGIRLATIHNLHFIIDLVKDLRRAIIQGDL